MTLGAIPNLCRSTKPDFGEDNKLRITILTTKLCYNTKHKMSSDFIHLAFTSDSNQLITNFKHPPQDYKCKIHTGNRTYWKLKK